MFLTIFELTEAMGISYRGNLGDAVCVATDKSVGEFRFSSAWNSLKWAIQCVSLSVECNKCNDTAVSEKLSEINISRKKLDHRHRRNRGTAAVPLVVEFLKYWTSKATFLRHQYNYFCYTMYHIRHYVSKTAIEILMVVRITGINKG